MPQVNYLAILVAGVINFFIGSFWYSPMLFGNSWMKLVNLKKENMEGADAAKPMVVTFVASFVTAYVLAHFINYVGARTFADGAVTGLWAWLGFAAATSISSYMFTLKPIKLFMIDKGYYLLSMVVMGGILAIWH